MPMALIAGNIAMTLYLGSVRLSHRIDGSQFIPVSFNQQGFCAMAVSAYGII